MTAIPQAHIEDSLKLEADGKVHLYELVPLGGGTVFFKSDGEQMWRGQLYESVPCALTGEEMKTEGTPTPKFSIGQPDVDLLAFKGLVNDGHLDGATLIRHIVLVDDLVNNRNIKQTSYFRVKRIDSYSRSQIAMTIASFSAATSQQVPFRQFITPDFPFVEL